MLPLWFDRFSTAFAPVIDGLCDPRRRRKVAFGISAAYGVVWLLYGVIAKSSQDINADMAEMVVWSREPALGYPKHPPLLAFIVKLWFAVFPFADWAFLLLAVTTVAIGIYLTFELAGLWLDGEKRAAAPFLLMVIPYYNFLGLKFDQNSVLIPLWALAMWAFVRSLRSFHPGWAALAGVAAGAAMMTKYWSVFLVAALALAALADRRRAAYFRSAAPWVTALVFIAIVLPHAVWLVRENFPPFTWVVTRRTASSVVDFFRSLSVFTFGTTGYASVALVLAALLFRPPLAALQHRWFDWNAERRDATLLFWAPLLLPITAAIATRTNLQSIWNTPALNLLPVMLMASASIAVPRIAVQRLAAAVTALTLIVLACSPVVALAILKIGVENDAAYARLAASETERLWRETTDRPLRIVGGLFPLTSSMAFYMTSRPTTFADFSSYLSPWVDLERIAREGIAIVCPLEDRERLRVEYCREGMNARISGGPPGRRVEVTLTRHWLGFRGASKPFVIATVPPRS